MAAKHTSGPWKTGYALDNSFVMNVIDPTGNVIIAEAYGTTREEAEEHARLISAAPELLETLRGVLRVADRKTDEFDAARAAIAKATGAA